MTVCVPKQSFHNHNEIEDSMYHGAFRVKKQPCKNIIQVCVATSNIVCGASVQ